MAARRISIVVATTPSGGIGKDGVLPWRLKEDMAFFKRITTTTADPSKRNAVIMGRKTWESIPQKFRPLPDRKNIVLSRSTDLPSPFPEGVTRVASLREALKFADHDETIESVFVIGGASAFNEALSMPECGTVYLTKVMEEVPCDSFIQLPDPHAYAHDPDHKVEKHEEHGLKYEFHVLKRI